MVYRNCRNKVPKKKKVSQTVLIFSLLAAVSIAGILYIVQVNELATMGYEIKNKEKQIEKLGKTNETLKIRAAELKSMHNLEIEKRRMQMKKPDEISYVELENPVALR